MSEIKKMSIKEVEKLTGISKQNIRYYEKQGLLNPERNKGNDYRIYSEEDVRRLLCIKLLRKLGMPIEQIRILLQQDANLQEALLEQKGRLLQEKKELEDAIAFCDMIREKKLTELAPEIYLKKMEEKEQQGGKFFEFLQDYKKVTKAEKIQGFRFIPDGLITTKEEFTKELFSYADQNHINLVITKEGMYPEFTIDGVAYSAYYVNRGLGQMVFCEAVHREDYLPDGMSEKRYRVIHTLRMCAIPAAILFFYGLRFGMNTGDYLFAILVGIAFGAMIGAPYVIEWIHK